MILQGMEIVRIGMLFPFFSLMYILAPHSSLGQTLRKPFIKFICHSASYFTFLCKYFRTQVISSFRLAPCQLPTELIHSCPIPQRRKRGCTKSSELFLKKVRYKYTPRSCLRKDLRTKFLGKISFHCFSVSYVDPRVPAH